MIEALKKLDKKFLILVVGIVLLPIILLIFMAVFQACGNKKISYEQYQEKMISAAEKYFSREDLIPINESDLKSVDLNVLVKNGYIKSSLDLLGDSTCTGDVQVRRNGSSLEETKGGYLNYTVNLTCKEYKTIHLLDKIKEDIVVNESGLYATGNGYVFKGNKTNNYINYFGTIYRIMSVDEKGILKLVKIEQETNVIKWDKKYNDEIKNSYGETIYKDSDLKEYLTRIYYSKKYNEDSRKHLVAHDACIGKRAKNNYAIDSNLDCSSKLENQLLSTLNVSDYALASYDADCIYINSKSCRNYNYLSNVVSGWTLNSVLENSYEVYYISGGLIRTDYASEYNNFNIVIHIDGNELYTEGLGTKEEPYLIK